VPPVLAVAGCLLREWHAPQVGRVALAGGRSPQVVARRLAVAGRSKKVVARGDVSDGPVPQVVAGRVGAKDRMPQVVARMVGFEGRVPHVVLEVPAEMGKAGCEAQPVQGSQGQARALEPKCWLALKSVAWKCQHRCISVVSWYRRASLWHNLPMI